MKKHLKDDSVYFWITLIVGKKVSYKNSIISASFWDYARFKIFFNRECPDGSYEISHIGQSAGLIGQIGHFLNETKFFPQKVGKWPKFQPNYVSRKSPMHQILARNMFNYSQRCFYILRMYKSMFYMSIYETKRLSQNVFQKNCSKLKKNS